MREQQENRKIADAPPHVPGQPQAGTVCAIGIIEYEQGGDVRARPVNEALYGFEDSQTFKFGCRDRNRGPHLPQSFAQMTGQPVELTRPRRIGWRRWHCPHQHIAQLEPRREGRPPGNFCASRSRDDPTT